MTDMLMTIAPKSDQLAADHLIGTTITIRVTKVTVDRYAEQPVTINYDGDDGRPFKPCKIMRRVLVHVWGDKSENYVGRSMTLYRDDKVQFGGLTTGGIRISHMSDIDREITIPLRESKKSLKPFKVRPLRAEAPPEKNRTMSRAEWIDGLEADLAELDAGGVDARLARNDAKKALEVFEGADLARLRAVIAAARERVAGGSQEPPEDHEGEVEGAA